MVSQAEKNVFGENVKLHPVTHMPIEQGIGALPEQEQAAQHLPEIEHTQGKNVADKMRRELGIPTAEEVAAKAAAEKQKEVDAYAALDENPKLKARIAELEKDVADLNGQIETLSTAPAVDHHG